MLQKLQKVIYQEVRAARGGDWSAILMLAELLKRQDRSQSHPTIPDNAKVFVATIDDRIAGMVCVHEIKDGIAPISNLYVLEQCRRQGIGTALLESVIAFVGPKTEIRLTVSRANMAGRIYRRLGFRLSAHVDLRLRPCRYN